MFGFILAVFSIKTYLWHQTDVVLEQLCGPQQGLGSKHEREHQRLTEGGFPSPVSLKNLIFNCRFCFIWRANIAIKAAPAGLWLNSHVRSHMRHKQKKTLSGRFRLAFHLVSELILTLNDKLFHISMRDGNSSPTLRETTPVPLFKTPSVFPTTVERKLRFSFIIYPKCSDLKPDYLRT